MKPILKYITAPISFWSCESISIAAKWIAITIDLYCDSPLGAAIGIKAIQNATSLSAKEVKAALVELRNCGALEINMSEDGQKLLKPMLYRESYTPMKIEQELFQAPAETRSLPWDEIEQEWKKSCPHLPPIQRWTPQRKGKLRSCMKNAGLTLEDLYKCFRIVGATPFLNGTRDWRATFQWLTSKSEHLSKVFEGFYAHSFQEKQDYELIMKGEMAQADKTDDYYK